MDPERQKRLDAIARIAVAIEKEMGLPAQLTIAQWAVESEWGSKPAGRANYYGMKKADRHAKCCTVTTHEVIHGKDVVQDLEFADYGSLEESARDYAWLITHGSPYAGAWAQFQQDRALVKFVFEIAQVYATGIGYARLALAISQQTNVREAIERAKEDHAT